KEELSGHSILDWPLQTHTSPTMTLVSVIMFWPETVKWSGPPALKAPRVTCHFPPFTTVVDLLFRKATVTCSPSSAQPQIGTRKFCWSTILSEKSPGSLTSASVLDARTTTKATVKPTQANWWRYERVKTRVLQQEIGE